MMYLPTRAPALRRCHLVALFESGAASVDLVARAEVFEAEASQSFVQQLLRDRLAPGVLAKSTDFKLRVEQYHIRDLAKGRYDDFFVIWCARGVRCDPRFLCHPPHRLWSNDASQRFGSLSSPLRPSRVRKAGFRFTMEGRQRCAKRCFGMHVVQSFLLALLHGLSLFVLSQRN